MKPARFNVTYEIVTPESAADGVAAELGFVSQCVSLREALRDVFTTRTSRVGGIEAISPSEHPGNCFRWVSVYNGAEFETGAQENRSIHIPDHITDSTRGRILRLMRA